MQIEATLELGSLVLRVGDGDHGRRLHQEALELAEKTGDPWYRELALFDLGTEARAEGRWDKAEQLLQEAITIAEESGEEWWRASCLDCMSAVLLFKGEYDGARILAEDGLRIRERFADRSMVSYSLLQLARVATATVDYNLASEYCRRALAVADEIGNPEMRAECLLMGSAVLASATGRYDDAKALILEAISVGRTCGYTDWWQCVNFAELGNVCLALGELADAREYLLRGLRGASEGGSRFVALNTLVGLAQLSAREGHLERAAELAALGLHHPSSDQATRDRAEALLAGLEEVLPREVFVGATTRGSGRELEEVAAEMLDGQAGPR